MTNSPICGVKVIILKSTFFRNLSLIKINVTILIGIDSKFNHPLYLRHILVSIQGIFRMSLYMSFNSCYMYITMFALFESVAKLNLNLSDHFSYMITMKN